MNEKNCITCEHFAWWDRDYCCTRKMRILQESKDGEFNEDIFKALESNKDCIDYSKSSGKIMEMYLDAFNNFLQKYHKKEK